MTTDQGMFVEDDEGRASFVTQSSRITEHRRPPAQMAEEFEQARSDAGSLMIPAFFTFALAIEAPSSAPWPSP